MKALRFLALIMLSTAGACTGAGEPFRPTAVDTAAPTQEAAVALPNLGPAPELENEVWLNVDQPLRLAELRGNVVLLDMWTFG